MIFRKRELMRIYKTNTKLTKMNPILTLIQNFIIAIMWGRTYKTLPHVFEK